MSTRTTQTTHAFVGAVLMTAVTLALTAMIALSASAARAETSSITVHSGDLNLATDSGREALQRRIDRAIDKVCGRADIRQASEYQAYETCAKTAQTNTTTQVEALVAAARSGKAVASNNAVKVN